LIDGQHRLWACVDADTVFETQVTVGLEIEAREVIDVGLRRSEGDVFKLRTGTAVSPLFVGTARWMMCSGRTDGTKAFARQDLIDFMERHRDSIAFALSCGSATRYITVAPVCSVIARAWYSADRQALGRFMEILTGGMPTGTGWEPVMLLRNWLVKSGPRGASQPQQMEKYQKTETAIQAFITGKKLTQLKATSEELFPLRASR